MRSLIAVGALCLMGGAVHAVKIDIQDAAGQAGSTVTVNATLNSEGASVAGTQNDITYTGAALANTKTCLRTNATTCSTDADCPLADPANASSAHEPCVVRPICSVSAAGKEGFFSFLKTPGCKPPDCACTPGTDCTAIRAIIVSLNIQPPTAIADGPLYSCQVGIPAGTTAGIPLVNSNQGAADPAGTAQTSSGKDGTVNLGCGTGDQTGAQCPGGAACVCVDDCDSSGDVFGNEVTKAVNIVAGGDLATCPQADANCDGDVFGNEVTIGVNNVANGCPGAV